MKSRIFILGLTVIFLTTCNSKDKANEKPIEKDKSKTDSIMRTENKVVASNITETTIDLYYGFKANIGQSEDFETFKTYSFFELQHLDKVIYTDTLLVYEFGDKLYPIVLQTGNKKYELLFEINDRPNKNYLKRLYIENNKLIKTDKLPTFITNPSDLDGDGIKEYAGFWCYSEIWGENNELTDYNPILYYKVKSTGIELDSVLTEKKNKEIYGEFHGFNFDEKQEMSSTTNVKFDKELSRIKK